MHIPIILFTLFTASLFGSSNLFDIAKSGYKDPIILQTTSTLNTKLKNLEQETINTLEEHARITSANELVSLGAVPIFSHVTITDKNKTVLSSHAIGIAERTNILPKTVSAGDVIIGLSGSALYTKGFHTIDYLIRSNDFNLNAQSPFSTPYKTFGHALCQSPPDYSSAVLPLCKNNLIKAALAVRYSKILRKRIYQLTRND